MLLRFKALFHRIRSYLCAHPRISILLLFLVFFLLYGLTAQRGVSWQDSGGFQYRVVVGDYSWNYGIALAHPGYIFLARVFCKVLSPLFPVVFATTLFSSFGMALAIALLAALVFRLTGTLRAAIASALLLGFAHMAWWMGTVAEVYGWSLVLLFAELLVLVSAMRGDLDRVSSWKGLLPWGMLFFLNGFHFSIHNFALLDLVVYLVLFAATFRRRGRLLLQAVAVSLVAFLLGATPLLVLVVKAFLEGDSLLSVISSVLFGTGYARLVLGVDGIPWGRVFVNLGLAALSLLTPIWLFAIAGFRRGLRDEPCLRRTLLALSVIHFLFWIRYFVPDQATFILPSLGLLAIWTGLGIGASGCPGRRFTLLLVTGIAMQLVVPLLLAEGLHVPPAQRWLRKSHRQLPYRDEVDYWVLPWKSEERSAELFARAVDSQLEEGGMVYADSTAAPPLMLSFYLSESLPEWDLYTPWNRGKADFLTLGRLYAKGGPALFVVTPRVGYIPLELLASRQFGFLRQGALYWAIPSLPEKRK